MRVGGVEIESTVDRTRDHEGQKDRRAIAPLQGGVTPGVHARIAGDVVNHDPLAILQGGCGGAVTARAVVEADIEFFQITVIGAGVYRHPHPAGLPVKAGDPGHAKTALFDGDATCRREQGVGFMHADDGLAQAAEQGIGAVELAQACFGGFALGDVGKGGDGAAHLALGVEEGRGRAEEIDQSPIGEAEAELDLLHRLRQGDGALHRQFLGHEQAAVLLQRGQGDGMAGRHRRLGNIRPRRNPGEFVGGTVAEDDPAIGIETDPDHRRKDVEDGRHFVGMLAQCLFGIFDGEGLPDGIHEQGELQDIDVVVVADLVGDADDGDDLFLREDRHRQETGEGEVSLGIAFFEGMGGRKVIEHDRFALAHDFAPEAGLVQGIAALRINHRACGHDVLGPGVEDELLALFVVKIDIAEAALGDADDLGQGMVEELLSGLGAILQDMDKTLQATLVAANLRFGFFLILQGAEEGPARALGARETEPYLVLGVVADNALGLKLPVGPGEGFGLLLKGKICAAQCQMCADASQEFFALERFGDKIHRPELQPGDPFLAVGGGAEKDDGNMGGFLARLEPPADLESVHIGHAQVQQDQVRGVGGDGGQGRFTAGGPTNQVAGWSQQGFQ